MSVSDTAWTAQPRLDMRWLPLALLAVTLPVLFAPSASPTSTFVNQWLAFVGGGLWLLVWALHAWTHAVEIRRPELMSGASLGVILCALLALAQLLPGAPIGQRLIPAAALVLAASLAWASACAARSGDEASFAEPLMVALVLAGLLSVGVSVVQVFFPQWAVGDWIAYPTTPGRAVGNMRQPNQLSTLLLWSAAALVWLASQRSRLEGAARWVLVVLFAALVLGVVLTASRTGTVGVLMLAIWGVIDKRQPAAMRWMMVAAAPLYALGWWGMEHWTSASGDAFYGDDQLRKTLHGDASSSRGKIWSNTWQMILAHPISGTGPGAFNFVWSMTPFPDRPVAFFDHSHNLLLQWAVEFGLPLALVFVLLLLAAAARGIAGLFQADATRARSARVGAYMVLLVGVHSLLEYPLWYIYFLLPAAVIAGWTLGLAPDAPADAGHASSRKGLRLMGLVGSLSLVCGLWAGWQYYRVAIIFEPGLAIGEPQSLAERIANGRTSVLFGHHADYAEVTMAAQPETVFARFERPLYHLLDTRIMVAYAKALSARGEDERARHVAARLREFRNPAALEFFAPCKDIPPSPNAAFPCGGDPGLRAEMMWPGGP